MEKIHILFNPKSANNTGENKVRKFDKNNEYEMIYYDITAIEDYEAFFDQLGANRVIIAGGDGTLSKFANNIKNISLDNSIYYYPTGTGNDFFKDLKISKTEIPVKIDEYLKNLPVIEVNGGEHVFINCVGGGLDAYACQVGNEQHSRGKNGSYLMAAVKGALHDYDPMSVKVTVDGVTKDFSNVWFVSCMKGRYFGGGIMLAPEQDRTKETVSAVIIHSVGRLRILPIIPGAFNGEHVKYKEYVEIIEGNSIEVEFDCPVPLQIDGETVDGVMKYKVRT